MTQRENVLAMLKGERPDGIVNGWQCFQLIFDQLLLTVAPAHPGATVTDPWGVTLAWDEGQPGPMPSEENLVCPDVTKWRDCVKALDIANMKFDWEASFGQMAGARAEGKFAVAFMPIGNFELLHNLMGFENALVGFLDEPEAMQELIDYIVEFRMAYMSHLVNTMKPDAVLVHDDWGSKESMLISPDIWREFLKPGYARMYGYMKEHDILVIHHGDSFLEPIVKDMEEIGIDIWQGALPHNDIARLQKELPGHMLFMGGLDAGVIDRKECDEAVIRREVRRACEAYMPGGKFIPCMTYGGPGAIFPGVDDIIYDEVEKFGNQYFQR